MRNNIIVNKMVAYIEKIEAYCKDYDYKSFSENSLLTEACVFNLSQLGELATKLDKEFTEKHSNIPWHQMRGLRNRIVHDYEGVNLKLVWEIISCDLSELKKLLTKIK